jgi:hypothetical protein
VMPPTCLDWHADHDASVVGAIDQEHLCCQEPICCRSRLRVIAAIYAAVFAGTLVLIQLTS